MNAHHQALTMGNRGGHAYRGTQIARAARQDSKVWRGLQPASIERVSEVRGNPGNTVARPADAPVAQRPETPRERARRVVRLVAGARRRTLFAVAMRVGKSVEDLDRRKRRLARLVESLGPRAMATQRRLEALAARAVAKDDVARGGSR